jgi:hypothetical protein
MTQKDKLRLFYEFIKVNTYGLWLNTLYTPEYHVLNKSLHKFIHLKIYDCSSCPQYPSI